MPTKSKWGLNMFKNDESLSAAKSAGLIAALRCLEVVKGESIYPSLITVGRVTKTSFNTCQLTVKMTVGLEAFEADLTLTSDFHWSGTHHEWVLGKGLVRSDFDEPFQVTGHRLGKGQDLIEISWASNDHLRLYGTGYAHRATSKKKAGNFEEAVAKLFSEM